ncbi:MAG: phospholipase [Candidatus Ozemobacter sibiricus]|jgi:phosphatidylserine/phosphatidylglycerophosphate/cardiolipin synthase-like enzyme|uniref:Phospholipase n=1 Tax=Candidatus Ozemobacter sibiricus TaxID=2268124 RepID=A0A367ZIZ0_9BACT|nr:MAG: phospholipase [Candidatus Ozemobacter sibiricus]
MIHWPRLHRSPIRPLLGCLPFLALFLWGASAVGAITGFDETALPRLVDQGDARIRLFFTEPPELVTPDHLTSERAMVELIEAARHEILFEAYYIQKNLSPRFVRALDRAARRGVAMRIILAELTHKDEQYAAELAAFPNVQVRFLDLKKDSFLYGAVHTKTIIVDRRFSTFGGVNYSYMGLNENRETNVLIDDERVAATLRALFDHDWAKAGGETQSPPEIPTVPRAGPLDFLIVEAAPAGLNHPAVPNLQPALIAMIRQAKREIVYEIDYYTAFGGIHEELLAAAARGVEVTLLIEERSWSDPNPLYEPARQAIRALAGSPVRARIWSLAPYGRIFNRGMMHSKAMVVDGDLIFIGSNNISKSGLLYSRELGVIFRSATLGRRLLAVFRRDLADPLALDVATFLTVRPLYEVPRSDAEGKNKTIRLIDGRTLRPFRTIEVQNRRVVRVIDHASLVENLGEK